MPIGRAQYSSHPFLSPLPHCSIILPHCSSCSRDCAIYLSIVQISAWALGTRVEKSKRRLIRYTLFPPGDGPASDSDGNDVDHRARHDVGLDGRGEAEERRIGQGGSAGRSSGENVARQRYGRTSKARSERNELSASEWTDSTVTHRQGSQTGHAECRRDRAGDRRSGGIELAGAADVAE